MVIQFTHDDFILNKIKNKMLNDSHSKTRQKRGAEGTQRLSGQIKVWVGVQRMCMFVFG